MRLLWFGDSAESGFGTVTREIGTRLIERGHDVRFVNQNVRGWPQKGPIAERTWNRDYFAPGDCTDLLTKGIGGWKAEQAVLLADFAAARDVIAPDPKAWASLPVWHHVPVEGRDLPPLWAKTWNVVRPVAITKFGANEISKVTGRPTPYIYHGVDRSVFHPATEDNPIIGMDHAIGVPLNIRSKADAKRHFGLSPKDIVLLRTDRHMPRKNYNLLLRSVAPILEERDDVKLVVHCRTQDFGGSLDDTKAKFSEKAQRGIGFTRGHDTWRGMGDNVLATLYNAADLYVSNCSEGYGLNLIESIACGTPVLGLDYSAVPEVVGKAGYLVPATEIDNIYDHYWGVPPEAVYTEALRELIERADVRAKLADRTQDQAAGMSWDTAADRFCDLFDGRDICEPALTAAA